MKVFVLIVNCPTSPSLADTNIVYLSDDGRGLSPRLILIFTLSSNRIIVSRWQRISIPSTTIDMYLYPASLDNAHTNTGFQLKKPQVAKTQKCAINQSKKSLSRRLIDTKSLISKCIFDWSIINLLQLLITDININMEE